MQIATSLPKILNDGLCRKKLFFEALQERPESMSKFFPYDEYLPEHKVFQNKDGSYGVVYKVEMLEHEPMTSREIVESVSKLKSWFNLPQNCVLQISYEQNPLSSRDNVFEEMESDYKNGHPVASRIFNTRLDQFKGTCNTPGQFMPLVRALYISIKYFPDQKRGGDLWSVIRRPEVTLEAEAKKALREIRQFQHIIADFESNCEIPKAKLNADQLLAYLRRVFNPKTAYKRDFAKYNPNEPISQQIVYNSPVLSHSGIVREGVKTRTLSLKTSPEFAYPGGMSYFCKLPFPFRLNLAVSFPSKANIKRFFDLKEFFLQNSPSARSKRQQEEVLAVQDRLARDDRCLFITFNITVEGKDDNELDRRTREVLNVFHNQLEAEAIVDEDIGLGLFLNSLPLGHSPEADLSTQRFVRMLRSDALNFVPIFDSFRGMDNGQQLFLSRENNLVKFSLLENETSNHTVVIADSGSGKSAFIINCIQGVKRLEEEPLVFILDKKSSYPMVAEYFDGDLDVFGSDDELSFSIFNGIFDENKIRFLTNYLIAAVKLTSPNFEIESEHIDAVSDALRLAYQSKVEQNGLVYLDEELKKIHLDQDVEMSMDDVVVELGTLQGHNKYEAVASKLEELCQKLGPFYGSGTYAKYFNGKSKASTKNTKFFVYDLDLLDNDPVLRTLISLGIMEEIRRQKKLPENQTRDVFVIIEEMGRLGTIPEIADMVTDFAETGRKLGMWLIAIAPRAEHFFEGDVGRAMWSVADNFILLQMNSDNVEYLKEHSSLIDEANSEIIKSLRTKKGEYAEFFYMNKKKTRQGAIRYIQTPKERWLAPTNARDAAEATKALYEFSDCKWKALEYLAEKFPNGSDYKG